MQRMVLTLLATERTLAELAEVPGPLQGTRTSQADWLDLFQRGTHHSCLLPHDDVSSLQVPGGHHVPPNRLVLLHCEWFLTAELVLSPVGLLALGLTVGNREAARAP